MKAESSARRGLKSLARSLSGLPDNPLSPGMVPGAPGELTELFGRLDWLAHPQPKLSTLDAHRVFQSQVAFGVVRSSHITSRYLIPWPLA